MTEHTPRWIVKNAYNGLPGYRTAYDENGAVMITGKIGDKAFDTAVAAVNSHPALLARIRELEEAAYHLRLARDAWNFDQTEDNFKILGDAIDRVAALNARG